MALVIMRIRCIAVLFTLQAISASDGEGSIKTLFDAFRDSNVLDQANSLGLKQQFDDILSLLKLYNNTETQLIGNLIFNGNGTPGNGLFSIFDKKEFFHGEEPSPSTCLNDTGRLMVALLNKENWAVQFIDATGKPGPSLTQGWLYFVGNYDQCNSAKAPPVTLPDGGGAKEFQGGYFQVTFRFQSIPLLAQIGLCLPDTCSEQEVTSLGAEIATVINGSISIISVQHLTNATEVTSATVVAIVVSCVIGLMMIFGTLFDIVFIQYQSKVHGGTVHPQNTSTYNGDRTAIEIDNCASDKTASLTSDTQKQTTDGRQNSVAANIILAFSVYSNAKKTFTVSQSTGSIGSIHGIRFLSISWVVLGHTYFFSRGFALNVAAVFPSLLRRWTFDAIANSLVSVDTFFTLSGLLTSYLTVGQLLEKGLKLNWPMFYFHRFWRLTPPYMLSILLYLGFQQYFITGPLRGNEQPIDKSFCEKNWWTNLLYINNLVGVDETCFGHSWYLANDMQFFILSPIMMIPFYFHRIAGLCSCFALLLASWIATGVSSTLEEWPSTGFALKSLDNMMQGGFGDDDYTFHYYLKPWCRIGPFIVGVLAGYVLAVYKRRPFYMKLWIVVLGWTTATVSALAVLYGLRGDITGDDPSSVGAAALYNTVARSVWGGCVSWVIIACTAGYGGPVNAILSWSPFVVLGRLSYMVYLLHISVLLIFFQNMDQPFYLNDTTMAVDYLGLLVASNIVAFVFMLALESPMIGLEKAIFKRFRKS